ncbi:alpha/beta-hydrolase [Phlegmacium glaucopus]|nr:alpha/beta-hydrolase [Phlegmacium glaucopus]
MAPLNRLGRLSTFTSLIIYLASTGVPGLSVLAGATDARRSVQVIGSTVTLDYGSFTGFRNETTGITQFQGIRFADAPIGDLRWRAPVSPPSTHLGDVDAKQFANACIPTTQTTEAQGTSEDCLFGNVFIPKNTSLNDKLPVMVWFHGGGFCCGDTHEFIPDLIMGSSAKPLIFVSFEYRLGQFGFLGGTHVHENGTLNAGLLDQRTALKWVQRYIHNFGGDPSQVTIWGQSAGAGSVMFHLIANGGNDQGLFRSAIADSPSLSDTPLYNSAYIEGIYQQYAKFAGCENQGAGTLQCLRSAPSDALIRAGNLTTAARPSTLFLFAPVIDGEFLQERPVEAFRAGRFSGVPVLVGSNTDEGAKWSASLTAISANTSAPNATEDTVFNFLQGQFNGLTPPSINKAIKELYPLKEYNNSLSLQGQQMYGEARYICTAALIPGSLSTRQKAYQYHYDNPHLGSNHAAELEAFFSTPAIADVKDNTLFQSMREYWTSFVTTGQPVSSNDVAWEPVKAVISGNPRLLLQPGNVVMEEIPKAESNRCAFWHGRSLRNEMQT